MPPRRKSVPLEDDPLWYKDAVIYQLHIRAFFDSNDDGIGDFAGLTEKLDYLADLGVTAVWLLPFYPSPLKDDGYDIADYDDINPSYGTMKDFKVFLREAHRRGLRVITELVINHTSDQHEWFQRARRAKADSRYRDFYVWSDTPEKYRSTRIIFKDFETSNWSWDPVAQSYFWHRFYHHQPDLNFDNPAVHRAVEQVLDKWMDMGVDGLRLDAVPYLYERENTSCENLPETHAYLKELRAHLDSKYKNRMLLAEANQWPEDTRPYFGEGDECHVAYHFPLMPRLFMSVAMEDRYPIIDIMQQTPDIPENCQWGVFLRNHDELTLEMVTDEDRDYMYKAYAQESQARINLGIRRRLAPLLGNHRRRIELLNGLLFAFPGTPFIYYGDEIGMGDNIYLGDRHGVRTPMQWSPDRNGGFSKANPQRLYLPVIIDPEYHYQSVNVESQQRNTHSLLWWMKRLIDLRKRYRAFGRGSIEFLHPENRKVLAFLRSFEGQTILVVANLSRFVQCVELDLAPYRGRPMTELFGHTSFPAIGDRPYFLTLGPHAFFWLTIDDIPLDTGLDAPVGMASVPLIRANEWEDLLEGRSRAELERAIASYLTGRRWFGGKARDIKSAEIDEALAVGDSRLAFVRVEYRDGGNETYSLPLIIRWGSDEKRDPEQSSYLVARINDKKREGGIYESVSDRQFAGELLSAIASRRKLSGLSGEAEGSRAKGVKLTPAEARLESSLSRAQQSNTSIIYGDQIFLKVFRRLEQGTNTDLELTRFLTERTDFRNIPPLIGSIDYRTASGETTLAIAQRFIPNAEDAWKYTLDALGLFFERLMGRPLEKSQMAEAFPAASLITMASGEIPVLALATMGTYVADAQLLGKRTAELHLALTSDTTDPAFAPESFTPHYQRSIYQSMRTQAVRSIQLLRKRLKSLPDDIRSDAEAVLALDPQIQSRLRSLIDRPISSVRTRIHGDYHLGQLLHTGKDFIILDFEGEPSRPLSERRIKRSPLRDVAGMLRSFSYAPYAVLFGQAEGVSLRADDMTQLELAARFWQQWASAIFLQSYLATAGNASFVPQDWSELTILLDAFILEKVMYELTYEMNNRPAWLRIPLRGVLGLVQTS